MKQDLPQERYQLLLWAPHRSWIVTVQSLRWRERKIDWELYIDENKGFRLTSSQSLSSFNYTSMLPVANNSSLCSCPRPSLPLLIISLLFLPRNIQLGMNCIWLLFLTEKYVPDLSTDRIICLVQCSLLVVVTSTEDKKNNCHWQSVPSTTVKYSTFSSAHLKHEQWFEKKAVMWHIWSFDCSCCSDRVTNIKEGIPASWVHIPIMRVCVHQ